MKKFYAIASAFMKEGLLCILLVLFGWSPVDYSTAQMQPQHLFKVYRQPPPFLQVAEHWVDSVLQSLTPRQRIGQLFMVAAYSNKDQAHLHALTRLVRDYHVGGVIFFQGGPHRQVRYTNHLQDAADVKLLVAIDGEWGLSMRLDSTLTYPRQLTLGALEEEQLIYEMGYDIARQCRSLGVHINFAPVVDVNNNPRNPVIGDRSFGEDKHRVARKAMAYMHGLQNGGVLACAKHFPGHGDTDKDSHKTLPVLPHSRGRLDSLELYPFKQLINAGLGSVMSAHLHIPALDPRPNRAASLSDHIVTGLLRQQLGFEGLVFTDALNMQGVRRYYQPGELEVLALEAGNDVLLFPEDVPTAVHAIESAIETGRLQQKAIDQRVRKLLKLKYWAGLHDYQPTHTSPDSLHRILHRPHSRALQHQLYESALTVARNDGELLPFRRTDTLRIATLSIGKKSAGALQQTTDRYAPATHFYIAKSAGATAYEALIEKLQSFDRVVVAIHGMSRYARDYGINVQTHGLLKKLKAHTTPVVLLFGSPYSLTYFEDYPQVVVAYEDNAITQDRAAQLLFGGVAGNGRLPVTASPHFRAGSGRQTPKTRLGYCLPEEVGLDSGVLTRIDSITEAAIAMKATPGCQVLVSRKGKVVLWKPYGHHSYNKIWPVQRTDLYDLASITKIAATTPAVMRLYELGWLALDDTLGSYLPWLAGSEKEGMTIRKVISHQAGLKDWIPFYLRALRMDEEAEEELFCDVPNAAYCIRITDDLYMRDDYVDSIWLQIKKSELKPSGEYLYSDLGFYLLQRMVESLAGQRLDTFVHERFYRPMGLQTMGYLPLKRFPTERIIPTELDHTFRKKLVHGHVHDPGAAMLGGVAGHAGLFSHAGDLAMLMQMFLNGGTYGGERFFLPGTIARFTTRHFNNNRRGLGFDKPEPDTTKPGPSWKHASPHSFGHSGFTGTLAWADPAAGDLVYIFLSNRIHPDSDNQKLIKENIRTGIHRVAYEAILPNEKGGGVP